MTSRAFRSSILHFRREPNGHAVGEAFEFFDDGLLVVVDGKVSEIGPAEAIRRRLSPDTLTVDYTGHLILPGFVDCHIHYPQIDIIASHGEQLLHWLERYVYPTERKFADMEWAKERAEFFLDELLRNGTTTAMVFATVHKNSVDAIFEAAQARCMRIFSGKVLMDRNCPADLRDSPRLGTQESEALIEKWHGVDRLGYAITPRFAPTSTEAQLNQAGRLAAKFPSVFVHSHLAENASEVAWTAKLFPRARSYLDVYAQHGLVRERSIFAHGVHMQRRDAHCMARKGATVAFCPSSNLFLGSGLFDLDMTKGAGVHIGLGTDVGAGTSLSLFETMKDAYKVGQLLGQSLSPLYGFYMATLGGARALDIDDLVGNFKCGKEADFIVLDRRATRLMDRRVRHSNHLSEELFAHMILGDDRSIKATYVLGMLRHGQPPR